MTKTYKKDTNEMGHEFIVASNVDGSISIIPMDEANSDYQAYLNKDKAEQSTPIVTNEAKTK
jgi:hypothetical protein